MKVWLPALKVGSGSDVFVERLATALTGQGVEVEITWFDKAYEFAPFLLCRAPAPPGTNIILANSSNGFAFKRPGIPLVIVELHCVLDKSFRPHKSLAQDLYHRLLIKQFETASFRKADQVVAISRYTARSTARVFGLDDISVIPLWVPTDKFVPVKIEKNTPNKAFTLLFVGNLIRRKGADLLVPIMKELGSDFCLRCTAGLRSSSSNDKLPDNITPLGRLADEDLRREYINCDALIFPSRFEGFGYVVLEAMACGKPVITSDNTALPELVIDGENGLLCPTDDVDSFADACRLLAGKRGMCRVMGEKGRRKALEEFSEERNGARYAVMLMDVWKNFLSDSSI